ncbi:PREDICTED: serine carboxypeptidase-like 45 isoform X2 [Nelumbo nucifera]|uniref:Carboxypeptidase n=2 Tax=Nelumbo nucifera TaxID=4432 RepID=A0A822ZEA1_NELNU|nr:PREDICTED: serine carboxypeptidase-like 45 isoform X2 [Nelumbo nucifera]DAD42893.1 TPA_asm: hypothetical protein HUJ06_001123 [Nelumbo nucifera]
MRRGLSREGNLQNKHFTLFLCSSSLSLNSILPLPSEAMNSLSWITVAALATTFLQLCSSVKITNTATQEADRIIKLPGQPEVNFQQYSGYITVDEEQQRALFYYFVEAETNPASKPLVLWVNGGPGCSSIGTGAFSEHGPFRPSGKNLVRNEYSWNKEANMLYLETPAGVGFSYSTNTSYYYGVNDEMTGPGKNYSIEAQKSYSYTSWFLRTSSRWLDKFPEHKNKDLFITGESYAGHYVPQLAQLMIQFNDQKLFNLKGIALGNPLLEFTTDFNSRAEFLWSHGLISDSTYGFFTSDCNYSRFLSKYYRGSVSSVCLRVVSLVNREISRFIDEYDVTLSVCVSSILSQSKALTPQKVVESTDVCVEDETYNYLNRDDVQKSLHAHLVGVSGWIACTNYRVIKYDMLNLEVSTIPVLSSLSRSGIKILVYSGDQDSIIPLTGTRTLVHRLANELGLNTTVPYRVWFEGKQVGGWTQVYGDILTFATIRGGSHEAPFSQPQRSLVLFNSFLKGKPLPEAF